MSVSTDALLVFGVSFDPDEDEAGEIVEEKFEEIEKVGKELGII